MLALLAENRDFMSASAASYDAGTEAEAKRLAVVIRVLVHQTGQSKSLLTQLKVQDKLNFLDTADPINPKNLLSTPGLLLMRMQMKEDGTSETRYIPPLGMERPHPPRQRGFPGWWTGPVLKTDDGLWTRKQLVISLANQEGGAHVDPDLNNKFEKVVTDNGLGWRTVTDLAKDPVGVPALGNPVAGAVRQIAYELETSLDTQSNLLV